MRISLVYDCLYPWTVGGAERWYRHVEDGTGRRYNKADITGPGGAAKGNPRYEIFGIVRYWRYCLELVQSRFDDPRDDLPSDLARIYQDGDHSLSIEEMGGLVYSHCPEIQLGRDVNRLAQGHFGSRR